MILADTSAWVEFERGTESSVHHRVRELLHPPIGIAVTEPVAMEILAGARDHHAALALRRLLARAHLLPFDAAQDFEAAASIYRQCRAAGVTPRGLLDCTVAAVALRTDAALLCRDVDLSRIAAVVGVALDPASRGAPRDDDGASALTSH